MNETGSNLASLDLNLITALDALLERRSVSDAAQSVGRTQSAMSHSLSRLRGHFADPILVRDGWTMHLTPFAQDLRPRVAEAARAARRVFAVETAFDPATSTRRIRIAAPDLCATYFGGFIASVAHAAPFVSVEFVETMPARQAVLNSDADIALGFGRPKGDANLIIQTIEPFDWCTFAPRNHAFVGTPSRKLWEQSAHVVVGRNESGEGPVEKASRTAGLARHVACYAPNFSAALGLAVECNALFTTLRAPFEQSAHRQGLVACAPPFDIPDAPAALMFRQDYGDAFTIWLRKLCAAAVK